MQTESGFPATMWPDVFRHANYVRNQSPTSRHEKKTPFEALYGTKPDLSMLRAFGDCCFVWVLDIPANTTHQLDDPTKSYTQPRPSSFINGADPRSSNISYCQPHLHLSIHFPGPHFPTSKLPSFRQITSGCAMTESGSTTDNKTAETYKYPHEANVCSRLSKRSLRSGRRTTSGIGTSSPPCLGNSLCISSL